MMGRKEYRQGKEVEYFTMVNKKKKSKSNDLNRIECAFHLLKAKRRKRASGN